jgi:hypothetical protein
MVIVTLLKEYFSDIYLLKWGPGNLRSEKVEAFISLNHMKANF